MRVLCLVNIFKKSLLHSHWRTSRRRYLECCSRFWPLLPLLCGTLNISPWTYNSRRPSREDTLRGSCPWLLRLYRKWRLFLVPERCTVLILYNFRRHRHRWRPRKGTLRF
jgi:hypothetical protein